MERERIYKTANKTTLTTPDYSLEEIDILLRKNNSFLWTYDSPNGLFQFRPGFLEKLDLNSKENPTAQYLTKLVHKEDKNKWKEFISNLEDNKITEPLELRLQNNEKNYSWFRFTSEKNETDNDKRTGLVSDITSDKNSFAETNQQNIQYQTAIKNSFGINIIVNKDFSIKQIHNPGMILRDIPEETIQKLTIDHFFERKSRSSFTTAFADSLTRQGKEHKVIVETNPVYTKTPKTLELIIQNQTQNPNIQGIIIDARDISEHNEIMTRLKLQREEYLTLSEEYEAQNRKIKKTNEELRVKNADIAVANINLRNSENRFLSLSRKVDQAITIFENNDKVFVSERLKSITGFALDDLYRKCIFSLAVPEDKIRVHQEHQNFLNSEKEVEEIKFWIITQHGERKYFINKLYREKISPKLTYTFIITTDNTLNKIQSELLHENQLKLKATLESLQKYIFVVDRKGYIIDYFKPGNIKHYLLDNISNLRGLHYSDLPLPSSFVKEIYSVGVKTQETGIRQTSEISVKHEGKTRWYLFDVSNRYNTINQNIGWTIVLDDITSKKETESKLKDRESQLFSLLKYFPDIVCLKDKNSRWLLANNKMLELYGLNDNNYVFKTNTELKKMYRSKSICIRFVKIQTLRPGKKEPR